MMNPIITAEKLRSVLHYNPDTGVFMWITSGSGRRIGVPAGSHDQDGYIRIVVLGREYRAARLAWLYMTGEWPPDEVDHRNLVKSDNVWTNLRAATKTQNQANRTAHRDNKSGLKGVGWDTQARKWRASINANHKTHNLGNFDCPAAAHFAYIIAADKAFGEFARAR
jgi:hypothetical protein